MNFTFALARREDIEAIRSLLAANDLPEEDLEQHVDHILLARDGSRLVGTVGVELLGTSGLLRSLCVEGQHRGEGLATALGGSTTMSDLG